MTEDSDSLSVGLIHDDGKAHCPNEECDWWVPEGMEYLYEGHVCADWPREDAPTYEEIEERLEELSDDA